MKAQSEAKETKSHLIDPFHPTLIITPEKMIIPSSGHLDVQIKNPTNKPFKMECIFDSFGFDIERAWLIENGKEVKKYFEWITPSRVNWLDGFEEITGNRQFSHEMKPGEVFYIRITNEDDFDGHKLRILYEKVKDQLSIKGHVHVPLISPDEKTASQAEFDLEVIEVFQLSSNPEKMKEISQKFAEYQKKREKLKRLRANKIGEDVPPWHMTSCICGEHDKDELERFVSKREKRNEKLLEKYGAKVDQLTDKEIREIKRGIVKESDEERERRDKEYQEEQRKKQEEIEKKRKKKKKWFFM